MGASKKYRPYRRSVVIHEDDVAMTHGANTAFVELSALGNCTSGAVMVPCPWFPELVELARDNAKLDIGVHLTLNSEKQPYRWRPVTRPSPAAGLTDPDGYFWSNIADLRQHADPEAVEAEFRAQIDIALAAGIDVTHLDGHMGAAKMPEFVDCYFRVGRDYNLPILLVEAGWRTNKLNFEGDIPSEPYEAVVEQARAKGFPIFDKAVESPWVRETNAETTYRQIFSEIPEGLTYLNLHFNAPGDFEVIEPELAHIRTDEYALFKKNTIHQWAEEFGINFIGMREIRDTLQASLGAK
jgi:predicted glycoside hydrolase/deacetylase ChbG (UPF0249 family)